MLILYAASALIFTFMFILAFIYCFFKLSRDGDVNFKVMLCVLILSFLAFYSAYGYVSTLLEQQQVKIKLY